MSTIEVTRLSADLPFGARVHGVDLDNVKDEDVRKQINDVFVDCGVIVFEDVEPTGKMQVALSAVFGRSRIML